MHYHFEAADLFSFRSAACFVEVVCSVADVAAADHVAVAEAFAAVVFVVVADVVALAVHRPVVSVVVNALCLYVFCCYVPVFVS